MRATRALIGSLGAGVTLAIASSVVLLLVSSVVAFRGWPGAPSEPPVDNVARLTDSGTVASHSTTPGTVAKLQLPAATRAAPTRAARHHRASTQTKPGASATTTQATRPSSQSTASATPAAPAQQPSAVHQVVTHTGQKAADAVSKTTQVAGQAIAPVAPPVGRTLEDLGAAGSDAVSSVTDTAGKLVP